MSNPTILDLDQLFDDLPGVTKAGAESCYEAIVICFEHHGHGTGLNAYVRDLGRNLATLELIWARQIDEKTLRAWGEPRNAVEYGAVGLAHLLIPMFTEYTIIQRANIGEGVDFWLGYKEDAERFKFQRKARLEVSGMLDAQYESQTTRRVREKIEQTRHSDDTGLPAYIIVTEFGRPIFFLVQK